MFTSIPKKFIVSNTIKIRSKLILKQCFTRHFETNVIAHPQQQQQSFEIEKLTDRTILKIQGAYVDEYLQGLITNDLSYIRKSIGSLYTMFLNDNGRLLTDGILYKTSEENAYLLDIDTHALDIFKEHLDKFIMRNSIQFRNCDSKLNVWQLFNSDAQRIKNDGELIKMHMNSAKQKWFEKKLENLVMVYPDPRSPQLGLRIITSNDMDFNQIIQKLNIKRRHNLTTYKELRYKLGIAEGIQELPPMKSNPLESNGDYLNGIHFNKGRYLGRDITSSLYLNGFIHNRMTPVIFNECVTPEIKLNDPIIINNMKKPIVGTIRGIYDKYGIALLRTDVINRNDMLVKNTKLKAPKPDWWPCMLTNEMEEEYWKPLK